MGGFLAKPDTRKHTEDGAGASGKWAYGVSAMQGWRQNMEDAHLALPDFDTARGLGLFGVFDGHGGEAVAYVAASRLPDTLRAVPAFQQGRYADALKEAFLRLDAFLDSKEGRRQVALRAKSKPPPAEEDVDEQEEAIRHLVETGQLDPADVAALIDQDDDDDDDDEDIEEAGEEEDEEEEDEEEGDGDKEGAQNGAGNNAWINGEGPDGMGCTAVVALVCSAGSHPEVLVANAGDSRCLLARGTRAVGLSRDHKPTLKCERQRILKAGGFVSEDNRVDGNLNLSRALGDFAYKKDPKLKPEEQKISCEAEVKTSRLEPTDRYLVLGCDGIFEKASNQVLLNFLAPRLDERAKQQGQAQPPLSSVCSTFLDHNVAKHPGKEQGLGCDNMTLMVVDLHANLSRRDLTALRQLQQKQQKQQQHPEEPAPRGPRKPQAPQPKAAARSKPQPSIGKSGKGRAPRSPGRRRLLAFKQARRKAAGKAA